MASARIGRLIAVDDISEPLRNAVETRWPGSKVSTLVSCPHCVSVWAALGLTAARLRLSRPWTAHLPYALACALVGSLYAELSDALVAIGKTDED